MARRRGAVPDAVEGSELTGGTVSPVAPRTVRAKRKVVRKRVVRRKRA